MPNIIAQCIALWYPFKNADVESKPSLIEEFFTKSKIETEIVIPSSIPTFLNIAKMPEAMPIFPIGAIDTIKALTDG